MSIIDKIGGNQVNEQQWKRNQDYEIQQVLNQCGYKRQSEYSPAQVAKIIDAVKNMCEGPVNTLIKQELQKENTAFQMHLDELRQHVKEQAGPIVRKDYLSGLRPNTSGQTGTLLQGISAQLFAALTRQLVQMQKLVTQTSEIDQIFTSYGKDEEDSNTKAQNKLQTNILAANPSITQASQLSEFETVEKALSRQLKTQQVAQKIASIALDNIQVAKASKSVSDTKNQLLAQQDLNPIRKSTLRQSDVLSNSQLNVHKGVSSIIRAGGTANKDEKNSLESCEIVLPGLDFYENTSVFRKQIVQYTTSLDLKLKLLGQLQERVGNELLKIKKYGVNKYYALLKEHLCSIYNFSRMYDRLSAMHETDQIAQRQQLLEHVYEIEVNQNGTSRNNFTPNQQQYGNQVYQSEIQNTQYSSMRSNTYQQITSPNTYYRELQSKNLRTELDTSVSDQDQMGIFFKKFGM